MTTTLVRRGLAALFGIVIMLIGTVAAATPAASSAAQPTVPMMTSIRTGQNAGFDRIVLDLTDGMRPEVSYRWVDELIEDGSGEIAWLTGEFFVAVTSTPARAHNDAGDPTYLGPRKFRTRDLRNVMAVAVVGDFEANLTIGLGTRNQSWVRVFTLLAPHRIVIDVGH